MSDTTSSTSEVRGCGPSSGRGMAPKRVRQAQFRKAAGYSQEETSGPDFLASAVGLAKGRIPQVRSGALPAYRGFFGVGPLDIALPGRRILDRGDPVIAGEDDVVAAHLAAEVERLAFPPSGSSSTLARSGSRRGDAVVVCGPASGHIAHLLMSRDRVLGMARTDTARWKLVDRETGASFSSPLDAAGPRRADHAYLARHVRDGHTVVHIAGLHALGSVGAAHYLTHALPDLFAGYGDRSFSMAVRADFDGLTPRFPEVLVAPRVWE
ncbi:MAG: hypothetical protein LC799_18535 [Actinobacteria bacterium]|nr:hypothetical protein [Actinomycetota bacterium]